MASKNNIKERLIRLSLVKKWIVLLSSIVIIFLSGIWFIPAIGENIPILSDIVKVAKDNQIDVGAYFYTEIEQSYEGEHNLRDSISAREDINGLIMSICGIIVCLVILLIGYRYLPQ